MKETLNCETCMYRTLLYKKPGIITPCIRCDGYDGYDEGEEVFARVKYFEFDSSDFNGMVKLMDNPELHGHIIRSINHNGEAMQLSIQENRIDADVFQHNHRIRHMVYHRDGTVEEMYEGTWTT